MILISFYSKELWRAICSPVHVAEQNSEQKCELKRLFKTGVRMLCGSPTLRRTERCHCFAAGGEPEMARNLHQVFGFFGVIKLQKIGIRKFWGQKKRTLFIESASLHGTRIFSPSRREVTQRYAYVGVRDTFAAATRAIASE